MKLFVIDLPVSEPVPGPAAIAVVCAIIGLLVIALVLFTHYKERKTPQIEETTETADFSFHTNRRRLSYSGEHVWGKLNKFVQYFRQLFSRATPQSHSVEFQVRRRSRYGALDGSISLWLNRKPADSCTYLYTQTRYTRVDIWSDRLWSWIFVYISIVSHFINGYVRCVTDIQPQFTCKHIWEFKIYRLFNLKNGEICLKLSYTFSADLFM